MAGSYSHHPECSWQITSCMGLFFPPWLLEAHGGEFKTLGFRGRGSLLLLVLPWLAVRMMMVPSAVGSPGRRDGWQRVPVPLEDAALPQCFDTRCSSRSKDGHIQGKEEATSSACSSHDTRVCDPAVAMVISPKLLASQAIRLPQCI